MSQEELDDCYGQGVCIPSPTPAPAPMTAEDLRVLGMKFAGGALTIPETADLFRHIDVLTARVAELEQRERELAEMVTAADESRVAQIRLREAAEARAQVAEAKLETARRDALEEAASECLILERDDAVDCPSGPAWKWYGKSRDHAAARIRALQTKDTTE